MNETLSHVVQGSEPFALAQWLHPSQDKTLVFVGRNDRHIQSIYDAMAFFAPALEVHLFPAWDTIPYDRASPKAALMAERMHTLTKLCRAPQSPRLVLTTANALLQRLPPKALLSAASLDVRTGSSISTEALLAFFTTHGYRRAGKAMEPGEYAVRGSIIDLVPPSGQSEVTVGIRLDRFGDEVESIRHFDVMTQVSQGTRDSITLTPASEVMLNTDTIASFREAYRTLFGASSQQDQMYEAISAGHAYGGMEHWLPLFYETTSTLLDYTGAATLALTDDAEASVRERHASIHEYHGARDQQTKPRYNPVPPERMFVMERAWDAITRDTPLLTLSGFDAGGGASLAAKAVVRGGAEPAMVRLDRLKAEAKAGGKPLVIACHSEGSRARIEQMLAEHEVFYQSITAFTEHTSLKSGALALATAPLERGFEIPSCLLLSEADLLGERIGRVRPKRKASEVFLAEAASFVVGELVVHAEHGIGRFDGLVTLTVQGATHDCLKLLYDGDDKLFVPVENIEVITRYGMDEQATLDKLGGAAWQSRKAKLKQRITIAAEALLKTAAERALKTCTPMSPSALYDEFCARFPYAETDDQLRAIEDVIEDLASGKPMDRLICGDVGFGKTEVALRAACVVAGQLEGRKQVAFVVPTTLLARQHARNFKERFDGFPIQVRTLSRMVSAREQAATREGLKEGSVDIVIGTHALLAKNIGFHNLGLVIVDEEQHFGVAQKERLKQLQAEVHVLTLSATPIPRTLQMALTGVRELSLVATPPIDRLAVRSFVTPYDPVILREALLREHHRGGRSFVVCPRIEQMAEVKVKLAELVPELNITLAHGQMPPSDLDRIMNDFYDGKFDILLSTAIIESGIDIPTANTMVIFNAQQFGLAQLYQLRGRVGRSKVRAYAYFLLPQHRLLSPQATRRLEVMQTLDTLGAGFTLASHDMDIRGFGNLVGDQQSGHIREVGIELYQQMLEEAVEALKASSSAIPLPASSFTPQINLGISVLIPEAYVSDLSLRLSLYRRAASLEDAQAIDAFAAELVDRFGAMPEETEHFIRVLQLKHMCRKAGIARIDVGPKGAVISFFENQFSKPEALLAFIYKRPRDYKLRPDQKLVFTQEWKGTEAMLTTLARELELVGGLG